MRAQTGRRLQLLLPLALLLGCTREDDVIATLRPGNAGGAPPVSERDCAASVSASLALLRLDFEDAAGSVTLLDSRGLQDAQMMGGSFTPAAGPAGCENGLALGSGAFAVVPNRPEWDLDAGSVEFWFRVPELVEHAMGLLGRDHLGTELPGHLSFWLTPDRTVTARLQGATAHATHCTETPLSAGQWVRVGFNFGAPGSELYVAGRLAARTGDPRVETIVPECGGTTPDGIAGNEQPWVLGFDTSRSGDALDGLEQHFDAGALDAFSISAERRDFRDP